MITLRTNKIVEIQSTSRAECKFQTSWTIKMLGFFFVRSI